MRPALRFRRNRRLGQGFPVPHRHPFLGEIPTLTVTTVQATTTVDAPSPTVLVLVNTVAGTASYDAPNISADNVVTRVAGVASLPTPTIVVRNITGWSLRDPVTLEVYQFEISPSETDQQPYSKNISYKSTLPGKALIYEVQKDATSMTWSGTLLTESEYTALQSWFDKRLTVQITDDLGRIFDVYITEFTPKRVRSESELWHHTYEMTALLV